jgi:hypothetical protein
MKQRGAASGRPDFLAAPPAPAPDVLIDVSSPQEGAIALEMPVEAFGPAARPEPVTLPRIAVAQEHVVAKRRSWSRHVGIGAAVLLLAGLAGAGLMYWPEVEAETPPAPAAPQAAAASAGPVERAPAAPAPSADTGQPSRSQAAAAPAVLAIPPAPVPAAAAGEPPAEVVPTIHLRLGAGLAPEERQRIQALLAEAGYGKVMVHEMPFSISRSRVGYFRQADRSLAEALVQALRDTHGGLELRDYGTLMTTPEPGRLDLWIRS